MNNDKKIFLIVNQGLHPVLPKIKRLYGTDIIHYTISEGNVELSMSFASEIATRTWDIIKKNDDKEVFIIWTGMPIYNAVVYNVVKSMHKNPIFLVYNKQSEKYEEFNIDGRNLIFNKEGEKNGIS